MPTDTTDAPAAAADCDHAGTRDGARFCPACGAALAPDATPTPVATAIPHPAGIPRPAQYGRADRARRIRLPRRAAVAVAVLAAAAVAAAGTLYLVQGQRYSPEQPARELIAALETGDGPALAALLGVEADAHPLLAAGALETGYEPPTDLAVVGVDYDTAGQWEATGDGMSSRWVEDYTQRPDMEHATVTIAYSLNGEAHTIELDATREGGGWARPWSLNPAVLETTVTPSARRPGPVQLAAATVDHAPPAEDDQWSTQDDPTGLLALPGVYTATAPGDALWTDAEATVAVPLGEDTAAVLSADIRPDAEVDTVAAVVAHIDACAAIGGYPNAECGWRDDSGWITLLPDDTPWTLETYPAVEVEPDYAGELEVYTVEPGSAVATYETAAGEARTVTAEVHANGTATLGDGGALVFQPQACDLGASYC
ncbi:zinc ribbon domain-containing protein [Glycomyces albidus]|uniref:Uncharacterized protein n=1 Tax=Glycomyces albidus TaxID=2656774 RepID=A0A6L5GAK8_9ACTN|nr:zinc ribbon domain-containing protein [Glycomyces albidus]MQM26648.1 hypothetical protein [Glycomyces albidus]